MEWAYLAFAAAMAYYSFTIFRDHKLDMRKLEIELAYQITQKEETEAKIRVRAEEKEEVDIQIEEVKNVVKDLQKKSSERQAELERFEKEMARRGKFRVQ